MDIEKQYRKIYKYCYFKVKNVEIAEDITQETFLRYFEKKGYFDGLPLLYTIARNLCIDEYRKKKPEILYEDTIITENSDDQIKSIMVREALKNLDEEEKEILLLRYVNELPVNDIAKIMNISRFTLYRKTDKALKKMKNYMGEEEKDEH